MTDLTFTKSGDRYISDVFTPNGDTAVELTFDEKGAQIFLQQSLSGDEWHTFSAEYEADSYYTTCIHGVVNEVKLRVNTTIDPTTAKYVEND